MAKLYAIVLTFHSEISREIEKNRNEFQKYVRYTIEPHLTLVQPFTPYSEISVINNRLSEVAERTAPFTLILDGIEYFEGENNVAYLLITNKKPVVDLHMDIITSIGDSINEGNAGRFHRENYIPHVSLGEQIPDEIFLDVKKRLSDYRLRYECEITDFSLFSGTMDGIWTQERVFELSG